MFPGDNTGLGGVQVLTRDGGKFLLIIQGVQGRLHKGHAVAVEFCELWYTIEYCLMCIMDS